MDCIRSILSNNNRLSGGRVVPESSITNFNNVLPNQTFSNSVIPITDAIPILDSVPLNRFNNGNAIPINNFGYDTQVNITDNNNDGIIDNVRIIMDKKEFVTPKNPNKIAKTIKINDYDTFSTQYHNNIYDMNKLEKRYNRINNINDMNYINYGSSSESDSN
jgi:hypothetical protein